MCDVGLFAHWCEKTVQNLVLFAYGILEVIMCEKLNDATHYVVLDVVSLELLLVADAQEQFFRCG